jgi:putative phosphoribosyl transferase
MRFVDRTDAGRRLAERLRRYQAEEPLVVGLPRGGVPVAAQVARVLDAPLDVLVVRKLGCPFQPELAMGAIGEDEIVILNQQLIASAGLGREEVQEVIRRERAELGRRVARYRGGRPPEPVAGRTVILVDDGLATGATARAAIGVLRGRGARRVVLAVPVASPQTVQALAGVADEVVAVQTAELFFAIGQFYADFAQTSDEEVAQLLARPGAAPTPAAVTADDPVQTCDIQLGPVRLVGDLTVPASPVGVVVFAHGSGSSRHSPRNRLVARVLNQSGLATLLLDLLTPGEELVRANVFDIGLLAERLVGSTRWLWGQPQVAGLPVGYFGASTGAAAALCAAAEFGQEIAAVVSRGGRPDLANARLREVQAPTLLIVGGRDEAVLELNRRAQARLWCEHALEVVPGATHLFEEPGALDHVAALAAQWFARYLPRSQVEMARWHGTAPSG